MKTSHTAEELANARALHIAIGEASGDAIRYTGRPWDDLNEHEVARRVEFYKRTQKHLRMPRRAA